MKRVRKLIEQNSKTGKTHCSGCLKAIYKGHQKDCEIAQALSDIDEVERISKRLAEIWNG